MVVGVGSCLLVVGLVLCRLLVVGWCLLFCVAGWSVPLPLECSCAGGWAVVLTVPPKVRSTPALPHFFALLASWHSGHWPAASEVTIRCHHVLAPPGALCQVCLAARSPPFVSLLWWSQLRCALLVVSSCLFAGYCLFSVDDS